MDRISRRGLWCCIVSTTSTNVMQPKTQARFLLATLATTKGESVAKHARLKDSDSEVKRTTFVRCTRVRILEDVQ